MTSTPPSLPAPILPPQSEIDRLLSLDPYKYTQQDLATLEAFYAEKATQWSIKKAAPKAAKGRKPSPKQAKLEQAVEGLGIQLKL